MFGHTANELLKEVATIPAENLPMYNDEAVQKVIEEISEHNRLMSNIFSDVQEREGGSSAEDGDWSSRPEDACAVLIHHDAVLRNKRLLLAYLNRRVCCMKEMWWRTRSLSADLRSQLGPLETEFFEKYDRLMNSYMGRRHGINLSLTVDLEPPKDPSVEVLCVRDHGDVVLSIGKVSLLKNTAHLLPREEAEPFIQSGILVHLE